MFEDDEHTMMVASFADGTFFADRYRIEEQLGAGAMGRVYRATELGGGRTVALKVLHADRLADEEAVARFRREAEVLASIGHPCIVEVYAFHHTREGFPYLAMELLVGVTLKTRLAQGRFEDPADLQEIVDGLAGALAAAHARGVVHRDIKPDNVFLPATGNPRAKLVDFGLSRIAKADNALTHSGMILGTPRYMPPEQIRDASAAGPAGDLYSLAVVLYECLTGESPYPAEDYGQLLGCLLEGRVVPFEERRPDLPALAPLFARALARDPAARFADAGALADAFGGAIGRPSQRASVAARAPRSVPPPPRLSRPSPMPSNTSTLAFDPSASRDLVAALEAAGEGYALDSGPTRADFKVDLPTDPSAPLVPPPVEESQADRTAPTRAGEIPPVARWASPAPAPAPAPAEAPRAATSPLAAPSAPAPAPSPAATAEPLPPLPLAHDVPPTGPLRGSQPDPPSRGGDTMFLGEGVSLPPSGARASVNPYGPGASPTPTPPPASPVGAAPSWPGAGSGAPMPGAPMPGAPMPGASMPAVRAPAASRSRLKLGIAIFLVAVVVVVAVSAAGGFLLRAYLATH